MSFDLRKTQGDFGITFSVDLILGDGSDVVFDANDTGVLKVSPKGVANPTTTSYNMNLTEGGKTASYTFQDGETDTPGLYEMEVQITFSSTFKLTWPHKKFPRFSLKVDPAL